MTAEVMARSAELATFMAEFFPEPVAGPALPPPPVTQDDQGVIDHIRRTKQGPKFDALMRGDTSLNGNDDSAADMALCSILASYYSGPDQVDRIFRQSSLLREKWDQRRGADTYGAITVRNAWDGATWRYEGPRSAPVRRLSAVSEESPPPPVQVEPGEFLSMFKSAKQIAETVSAEPDWIVEGWVAVGAITELDAKQKTGKTTLYGHMCRYILDGVPSLGFPTKRTRLVLLAEEGEQTIREWIEVCGLQNADDLQILSKRDDSLCSEFGRANSAERCL